MPPVLVDEPEPDMLPDMLPDEVIAELAQGGQFKRVEPPPPLLTIELSAPCTTLETVDVTLPETLPDTEALTLMLGI